ncbi:MAG: DUF2938 domain-containing protein [Janthinobacterium lividum]
MVEYVVRGTAIGIGATLLMDVWTIFLCLFFGQPSLGLAPLGRWFWHLRYGRMFHDDIAASEPYRYELLLGWIGHYLVGIVYGIALVWVMGPAWLEQPTFIPAWVFGIVTVGAGWFLLQPGLGIGWAASKLPSANEVRIMNLVAHTAFGAGLYGTAVLLR